jgi:predicted transcriptional regulator
MTRSKLELYGEVLQALAKKRLTIDSIAFECNTDCIFLSQRLDFLAKCGLVQEETYKNKTLYTLTRRGIAVSNTLAVTRHLQKLKVSPEMTE